MKFKFTLATATALTMIMASGAAWAGGGNDADALQSGTSNSAVINQADSNKSTSYTRQTGQHNSINVKQGSNVYFQPTNDAVGLKTDYANQNGDYNVLQVTQHNGLTNNDRVGAKLETLNGGGAGATGSGFDQLGNYNYAYITQGNNRNIVGEVLQDSRYGNGNPANYLTINQGTGGAGYGYNVVNSVKQIRSGGGSANIATINQYNSSGTSDLNRIETVYQYGQGNSATLNEFGSQNRINTASQSGNSNTLNVSITGNFNGTTGVPSGSGNHAPLASFSGTYASSVAGVTQGSLIQDGGNSNSATLIINGDQNLFGTAQHGSSNSIYANIQGSMNQLAVYQSGNSDIAQALITGASNDVGISQSGGDGNQAYVSINGSNNMAHAAQVGYSNYTSINQ